MESEKRAREKGTVYKSLVSRMRRCGWKVEYKQVALGTRGSVYSHLTDALTWLGVQNFKTKKGMVKEIALHGAREASRALRTYEWLSRTEQGGHARIHDG